MVANLAQGPCHYPCWLGIRRVFPEEQETKAKRHGRHTVSRALFVYNLPVGSSMSSALVLSRSIENSPNPRHIAPTTDIPEIFPLHEQIVASKVRYDLRMYDILYITNLV